MLLLRLHLERSIHQNFAARCVILLDCKRTKSTHAPVKLRETLLAGTTRCGILFGSLFFGTIEVVQLLTRLLRNPRNFLDVKQRPKPPAITYDKKFGEHHIAKLKDVSLHYVANGKHGAPLVVMIHGWPECWWSWRYQLPVLAQNHYAVALDMRGYCDSSKPSGVQNYRVRKIVEDIKALVEHLGYQKCVVIGHDWGGTAAWSFALQYPEVVQKLIVLNCPHPTVFGKQLFNYRNWPSWWYLFYFQLPKLPEISWRCNDYEKLDKLYRGRRHGVPDRTLMTDEDIEMFKYAFSRPGSLTASMNYYRSQFSLNSLKRMFQFVITNDSKLVELNKVRPQTLVLWGKRDQVLTSTMAAESLKHCHNAELRLFENASHWLQQHEPKAVNEAILEFLTRK